MWQVSGDCSTTSESLPRSYSNYDGLFKGGQTRLSLGQLAASGTWADTELDRNARRVTHYDMEITRW